MCFVVFAQPHSAVLDFMFEPVRQQSEVLAFGVSVEAQPSMQMLRVVSFVGVIVMDVGIRWALDPDLMSVLALLPHCPREHLEAWDMSFHLISARHCGLPCLLFNYFIQSCSFHVPPAGVYSSARSPLSLSARL